MIFISWSGERDKQAYTLFLQEQFYKNKSLDFGKKN